MSRHKDIHDYISTQLNNNNQNLSFKLFYKYSIQNNEFSELLVNSVDLGEEDPNNVKIKYDGQEYNTQKGVFTLENVKYIPCIIESFGDEFQPLDSDIDTIIKYRVPVTFFVDERYNKANADFVDEAIEYVQDSIRGRTNTIGGYNMFITHSAFEPQTGLVTINERPFRRYQLVFFFKATKKGSYGQQIQTFIQNNNLFSGEVTRIYPIARKSPRVNELLPRQKFETETDTTEVYEIYNIPDISALELEMAFVYKNDEFTRHFMDKKYAPTKPEKYTISIVLPGYEGNPFSDSYLIENIGGPENYDDQMMFIVTFKKASVKYNG